MKSVTLRLPDSLVNEIEAEARKRQMSKTEVMRERLTRNVESAAMPSSLKAIAHVIGSIDELPSDLSRNKKTYFEAAHGRIHPR